MNDPSLPWILAGSLALAAALLAFVWNSARAQLATLQTQHEERSSALNKLKKKFEERKQALATKQEEIEALRKKLGKAKKRVASVHQDKSSEDEKATKLAEELEGLNERLLAAKQEIDRLRGGETAQSKTSDLGTSKDSAATPNQETRASVGERSSVNPAKARPLRDDERERLELRTKTAETQSGDLRKKLSGSDAELRRVRGRAETNRRVYLVTKAELESYKDRYHTMERQLGARGFRRLLNAAIAELGEDCEPSKGALRPSGIEANDSASAFLEPLAPGESEELVSPALKQS